MTTQITKKNDFIELEFIGRTESKEGPIFDTTIFEKAKEAGLADETNKARFKPTKICIGQQMVLKNFDKELEDKEIDKEYEIEIKVKEAYGPRDAKLIKTVPLTAFEEMPQKGMFVNVNGMIAKVISITGGRILIDMNHPLAGKDLYYKFKILRIIEDTKEKAQIILEMFGIKPENVELDGKLIVKEKVHEKIQQVIKGKIKELLDIETEFSSSENLKKSLEQELANETKEKNPETSSTEK
jgi:peptidylprolyl isomerase